MFKLLIIFGFASTVTACGSIGGGTDGQIYQNPTLEWRMNPPAAWTYPEPHAPLTQSYFPGQPLTQTDAANQADGDLTAAALEALTANQLPTQNVRIISNYQPQLIGDCIKVAGVAPNPTQTMIGNIFGIVEQGAVTKLATAGAAIAVADCAARNYGPMTTFKEYVIQGSLSIEGITLSGLQLKQVVAQIQNTLAFNYHVRFVTPITYA